MMRNLFSPRTPRLRVRQVSYSLIPICFRMKA